MGLLKWMWPLGLLGMGAAIFSLGFLYDLMFAGLPYQDPTAAMAARYALHANIAAGIRCAGGIVALAGCFAAVVMLCLWIARKRTP